MLSAAREKCDADVRRAALPELPVEGSYGVVIAIRGVVNHLPPDDLAPTLQTLEARLVDGGLLVFDLAASAGGEPSGDRRRDHGRGRLRPHRTARGHGRRPPRLAFDHVSSLVPSSISRRMTPFEDGTLAEALEELGLAVETFDGYGPDDDRTVFVASG